MKASPSNGSSSNPDKQLKGAALPGATSAVGGVSGGAAAISGSGLTPAWLPGSLTTMVTGCDTLSPSLKVA